MFRFPRNSERRKKWEAQVKRDRWHPTDSTKICEGQLASCTVPVCKFARGSEAPDAVLCGRDRSLSSNNAPAPCAQKLPNHGRMYFAGVSCLVQAAPAADTPKGRKKIAKGSAGTSRYPGGQRGEMLCQKHNEIPLASTLLCPSGGFGQTFTGNRTSACRVRAGHSAH
ncbi:hypothetical protein HPB50_000078 [Hyalomma asiaticum]|uniref:Uncharacterized protein n=1 Tax=Hyalomma asiaticum TaxID=266040 RepID=A0ACB7SZT5_HYAAI|nr:hypothetical protein HPB50_000078 [Hyalomma asiaticum]